MRSGSEGGEQNGRKPNSIRCPAIQVNPGARTEIMFITSRHTRRWIIPKRLAAEGPSASLNDASLSNIILRMARMAGNDARSG